MAVWTVIFSQVAFGFFAPMPAHAMEVIDIAAIGSDIVNSVKEVASTTAGKVAVVGSIVTALGAGASLLSSGNMNSVMSDVEQRYHIDPASVANLGETMNTSANKETAPQMNLFFNPSDPKVGKEVTAQAFPMYFSSPKENMYFTWYLKREGCNSENEKDKYKTPENGSALEKSCDADGNGTITENDWKVEAMRRIAGGGFAGDQVDYSGDDGDNDEYAAQHGGDKSTSKYCYIHDFKDGTDYELKGSGSPTYFHTIKPLVDASGKPVEGGGSVVSTPYEDNVSTPHPYVTQYEHSLKPGGNEVASPPYVSTNSTAFTATGQVLYYHTNNSNGIPQAYVDTSNSHYDGYYHTNNPDGTLADAGYIDAVSTAHTGYEHTHNANNDGMLASPSPYRNNDPTVYLNDTVTTIQDTVTLASSDNVTPASNGDRLIDTVREKYYATTPIDTVVENYASKDGCMHFFPHGWVCGGDDTKVCTEYNSTGDGRFTAIEEKFWHTDPKDPSTAQNGNKDEANVVGLGQDKFTWNYAPGDQVGVVIEGLSMLPTKRADASNKVMFAFSKNSCELPDRRNEPSRYGTNSGANYNGGVASIPTVKMDMDALNNCLKDNLVDPAQGDQAGKLELQLAASPENPIIDSFSETDSDRRGDMLTVQSSLVNSATPDSRISYEWHVYANSARIQTADSSWDDITTGLVGARAVSSVKGNALSNLKINLNLDSDTNTKVGSESDKFFAKYFGDPSSKDYIGVGYLRIGLTATENFESGSKRVGRSSIIVKVTRAETQIETHVVDVDIATDTAVDGSKYSHLSLKLGDSLCEDASTRSICPVVKGQIVGLSFDASKLKYSGTDADISWMLNDKPLRCNKNVSSSQGCIDGTKNFFPVTGEAGEVYKITMSATNPLSGKSLTLNRVFQIVEPSLLVASADSKKSWPKLLGHYVEADGSIVNNYSQDIFEAPSGESFALKGLFYPGSLKDSATASWSVDGSLTAINDNGTITIAASQTPGSVHTVSLRGAYIPSPKIKKALSDIWGISVADVTETTLSSDVQVEVIAHADGLASGPLNSSKKFFASIISYVPSSVLFLFRLVATMGLILLVLGIIFSFVPERRRA